MCPQCKRHHLVEVEVKLAETAVTMHACSACGCRWWDREGERVRLDDVLALAAARR